MIFYELRLLVWVYSHDFVHDLWVLLVLLLFLLCYCSRVDDIIGAHTLTLSVYNTLTLTVHTSIDLLTLTHSRSLILTPTHLILGFAFLSCCFCLCCYCCYAHLQTLTQCAWHSLIASNSRWLHTSHTLTKVHSLMWQCFLLMFLVHFSFGEGMSYM